MSLNMLRIAIFFAYVEIFVGAQSPDKHCWRYFRGTVPSGAFKAADDVYVAAVIENGLIPSTFDAQTNTAITETRAKKVTFTQNIMILCNGDGNNLKWEYVNIESVTGDKLRELVVGGMELNTTLYIGKVFHQGQWKVGKVYPSPHKYQGLRVWDNRDGSTHVVEDFEILEMINNPTSGFRDDENISL